jgi:hypothetical protein
MIRKTNHSGVLRIFDYIDPLFIYIPVIYYASKIYQWSRGENQSVWESLWERVQLIFGNKKKLAKICFRWKIICVLE